MLQAMREGVGRGVAVVILSIIALGFIFFGVDFTGTTSTFAARVNGETIPLLEFERVLQDELSQYQQAYRIELTDDFRRQIRGNVVENMVRNLVLEQRVEESGYRVSDARVLASIRATPAFQVGGEFVADVYRTRLATSGIVPIQYEEQERTRLALQDLQDGIINSTFLTPAEFRAYIELTQQRRQIAYAAFNAEDFSDGIEISDAEVAAYYADNGALYMTEESVDFEYVEIALADIAANTSISEEELREYYDDERDLFATEEERSVRHILIVEDDAAAANSRADEVLARLEAGESFEDLASEVSDDPGTRAQGGDLGRIVRGMLVGPFEDAVFDMAEGEVRGPVRSDFGVHIIRLDAISAGDTQSFEAVRDDLLSRLRTQRAEDAFYDLANTLGDRAFYAEGDLAAIAAEMMLPLITVTEFPRTGDLDMFTNSAAVVQAAFSDDVLSQGRNSDLIELSEDNVMVLRVVAHNEPVQQALDDVREEIVAELTRTAAAQLARDAAETFRAEVDMAEDLAAAAAARGGTWSEPIWIGRGDASVPTQVVSRVFALSAPTAGDARWENVLLPTGDEVVVALYAVEAGAPEAIPREDRDERQRGLGEQAGVIELAGYAAAAREAATVRIPSEVLDPVFY